MNTNKMTYVKALDYVLADEFNLPTEVADKLAALKDSLTKRSTTERKPTAAMQKNEDFREEIVNDILNGSEGMTITEIANALITRHNGEEFSNQKVNQLVAKLVKADAVERFEVKRKAYFRVK